MQKVKLPNDHWLKDKQKISHHDMQQLNGTELKKKYGMTSEQVQRQVYREIYDAPKHEREAFFDSVYRK